MIDFLDDWDNFATAARLLSTIEQLERLSAQGSGIAGYTLALVYDPGNTFVPEKLKWQISASEETAMKLYRRAFYLLLKEAEEGDGEAMHLVAMYYQSGYPPVSFEFDKFIEWNERAFAAGYIFAANDLYSTYANEQSKFFDREKARRVWDILEATNMRVIPEKEPF